MISPFTSAAAPIPKLAPLRPETSERTKVKMIIPKIIMATTDLALIALLPAIEALICLINDC